MSSGVEVFESSFGVVEGRVGGIGEEERKNAVVENEREGGEDGEGDDGVVVVVVALLAYPYRLIRSGELDEASLPFRFVSKAGVEDRGEVDVKVGEERELLEVGAKIGSPYSSNP